MPSASMASPAVPRLERRTRDENLSPAATGRAETRAKSPCKSRAAPRHALIRSHRFAEPSRRYPTRVSRRAIPPLSTPANRWTISKHHHTPPFR